MDQTKGQGAAMYLVYRVCALAGAMTFAGVGLVFFVAPGGVVEFFNGLSLALGLPAAPLAGHSLYLALTAGYMYLVTLLAWQMYRHPRVAVYPWLLAQAKLASAVFSLALVGLDGPYLIYWANFAVDGAIGLGALALLYLGPRRWGDGTGLVGSRRGG